MPKEDRVRNGRSSAFSTAPGFRPRRAFRTETLALRTAIGPSPEWDGGQSTPRLLIQPGKHDFLPLLELLLGLGEGSERSIPVPAGCFQRMLAEDVLGGSNVGEGFGGEGYFHAATVGPPVPAARGLVTVSEVSQELRSPQPRYGRRGQSRVGTPGCRAASWRQGGRYLSPAFRLDQTACQAARKGSTRRAMKVASRVAHGRAGVLPIDARLA